jgi:hypothetical protein
MGIFRSNERQTVEAVREKLTAAEMEVHQAEQALRDGALAAALSSDPFAAEPQRDRLRRAREAVEVLGHAVAAAEEAERQAMAQAKAALRNSQNRSIRQKLSMLIKEARRIEDAETTRVQAFAAMVRIAADIQKLIPNDDRDFQFFATALSKTRLSDEVLAESNRLSALQFGRYEQFRMPGTSYPPIGFSPAEMAGLAARLEAKLLQHFKLLVGKAPPPVAIPGAEPEPAEPRRKPKSPALADPETAEVEPVESDTAELVETTVDDPVEHAPASSTSLKRALAGLGRRG